MPTTATTTAPQEKKLTKTEFIRSLPHMPAAEVVEKGKEKGIQFDSKYVWKIRSTTKLSAKAKGRGVAKSMGAKKVSAPARGPMRRATVTSARKAPARTDELLISVASAIGLANAIEILEGQRRKVLHVLGG